MEFNDDLFSHEELTVIGILTGLILWLVWERRHFTTNAGEQLTEMEKRLTTLEREFINTDQKIVKLFNDQQTVLREIRDGQTHNLLRMWDFMVDLRNQRKKQNESPDPTSGRGTGKDQVGIPDA